MSGLSLLIAIGVLAASEPPAKPEAAPPPGPTPTADEVVVEQVDVGTKNVLERLKLLRVQMALDQEEIAAIELRLKKIRLQRAYDEMVAPASGRGRVSRATPPPAQEIIVKAITLKPNKEAIILYQGRIFTVRPGDTLGDITIKDIGESGLQVSRSSAGGNVPVAR